MAPNTTNRRNQPSSFPGIYKYPTKRDELFTGNALDWIAGKLYEGIGFTEPYFVHVGPVHIECDTGITGKK